MGYVGCSFLFSVEGHVEGWARADCQRCFARKFDVACEKGIAVHNFRFCFWNNGLNGKVFGWC